MTNQNNDDVLPPVIEPLPEQFKLALTDKELQFAEMLKGLDLFYAYSDSNQVYLAGKKALDATFKKGKKDLGLSEAECNAVLRQVMKRQTGK